MAHWRSRGRRTGSRDCATNAAASKTAARPVARGRRRIPWAPQPRSSGPPVQPPMETRQSELIRVLQSLAAELPNPDWVALVDGKGLIIACIPAQPAVGEDRISAMAAASLLMADRGLEGIGGGGLRFARIAGAKRQ